MATFKEISAADIKTSRSALNQLVDVIQEDVSGSATRRAYQVFVTGSGATSVTASLFQTVYDQDYTLQTANSIFDMTVGLTPAIFRSWRSSLVKAPVLAAVFAATFDSFFASCAFLLLAIVLFVELVLDPLDHRTLARAVHN